MIILGCALILLGSIFSLIAAIGLIRMPDIFMKMHAATKAGTLGCGLVLLGVALEVHNAHTLTSIILLIFFITLTNPIAAHLVAKAAAKQAAQK